MAIYSKAKPQKVISGIDWRDVDKEGRFIEIQFKHLSVISLYLPSGTSGEHRQSFKYQFLDRFLIYLNALDQSTRDYIICGDRNIAHNKIDLKNWCSNQKKSGFLPEERAWRSNRGQAWAKNVGWRIDYQIISGNLADKTVSTTIYKEKSSLTMRH